MPVPILSGFVSSTSRAPAIPPHRHPIRCQAILRYCYITWWVLRQNSWKWPHVRGFVHSLGLPHARGGTCQMY